MTSDEIIEKIKNWNLLCDILFSIKEFYAFEALSALAKPENFRHSHERWMRDFDGIKMQYNCMLANIIYDYTVMVVAGEMRHGHTRSSHHIAGFYDDTTSREGVYRECIRYSSNSILTAGMTLFGPRTNWNNSFGGEKWHAIAEAGLKKTNWSDVLFIDHCVDLTHNGSIYFDKNTDIVKPLTGRQLSKYHRFLDFKRYCSPEQLLEGPQSSTINCLTSRAVILGIIDAPPNHISCDLNFDMNEKVILSYQPVVWGSEILQDRLEDSCRSRYSERRNWRAA